MSLPFGHAMVWCNKCGKLTEHRRNQGRPPRKWQCVICKSLGNEKQETESTGVKV